MVKLLNYFQADVMPIVSNIIVEFMQKQPHCSKHLALQLPQYPEPMIPRIEYLRQFGYELGIAFQIIDDILDFTSNQEQLGKPVGGDFKARINNITGHYIF